MPKNSSALPELSKEDHKHISRLDGTSTLVSEQEDLSPEETFFLFASLQEIAHELRSIKYAKEYPTAR